MLEHLTYPWSSPSPSRPVVALTAMACLMVGQLACAGTVKLSTDRRVYSAGDRVEITLDNQGLRKVGYNLCTATLERETGDGWEEVAGEAGECPSELEQLKVNRAESYKQRLGDQLTPGQYRFTTSVEIGDGSRELTTTAFTVE